MLSAAGFGVSESLAKWSIDRAGHHRSLIYIQGWGILFLLLPLYPAGFPLRLVLVHWKLLISLGILNLVANYSLFYGLRLGQLSVVSPVVATFSVYTVALSCIYLGERPSFFQWIGIGTAITGILAIASHFRQVQSSPMWGLLPGVGAGLLSAVSFGVQFFLFKYAVDDLGPILPILIFRAMTVAVLLMDAGVRNTPVWISDRRPVAALFVAGGFDALAYFLYNSGIQREYASLVVTMCGIYPAFTILLAQLFLRERLTRFQWGGAVLILAGIAFISLG